MPRSSSNANERPGSIVLEPMDLDDLEQVLWIERDSFSSPWRRDHFLHELRTNRYAVNRVLKSGDRVLGYSCTWIVDDELRINNIAVHPDHRRQGLARRLLWDALHEARGRGCRRATLEVRPSNGAALRLYRQNGFVQVGRRRNYYRDEGEDALLMEAALAPPDTDGPGSTRRVHTKE
jgi:ribosomal-protein-alanine N-acetyltransferase